jgi:hypothetical protein
MYTSGLESGGLFAFGVGESGQLGLGDDVSHNAPMPVKLQQKLSYRVLGDAGSRPRRPRSVSGKQNNLELLTAQDANRRGSLESNDAKAALSASTATAAKSTTSTLYDQPLLESTLREQLRNYQPSVVIRYCHDWHNFSAASIVCHMSSILCVCVCVRHGWLMLKHDIQGVRDDEGLGRGIGMPLAGYQVRGTGKLSVGYYDHVHWRGCTVDTQQGPVAKRVVGLVGLLYNQLHGATPTSRYCAESFAGNGVQSDTEQ